MSGILKFELRRAFINRMFLIALLIGLSIALSHIVLWVIPNALAWETLWIEYGHSKGAYPHSLYNTWMGLQGYVVQAPMYFFILPLLACIPVGAAFFTDRVTGYAKMVVTRVEMGKYYQAKAISVFLSAGTVCMLPLLVGFFLTALFFPAIIPEPTAGTFPIGEGSMWVDLYYAHPLLYVLLYLFLIFFYSGLIGAFAMVFSYVAANRVFAMLAPFVVCTFANFVLTALPGDFYKLSPIRFLQPTQPGFTSFAFIAGEYLVLSGFFIAFFLQKAKKDEIY